MSAPASPRLSASARSHHPHVPALCASAGARLLWAVAALLLLWTTVFWALH
ncbi:hypothetical protein [Accumulibacter sp.]|uniref:hypothetical protein n=1 Tax=Accumulibacter sp. TaxID=2053492 RepID=UPI001E08D55B|nr:hypothetical protein [Accumulibacter sp.]MCB1931375.1 hypothetical protein [Accumulibacter sp.]MCB1965063.1 hypothetical protein [Accumulibacter sp.]MCP5229255.1 hypothetical protein [Accumulibacter sp.]